jgi:hypothetical protein
MTSRWPPSSPARPRSRSNRHGSSAEFPLLLGKVLEAYDLHAGTELADELQRLESRTDDDFWVLVDEIAALGDASPAFRSFLKDLLPLAR